MIKTSDRDIYEQYKKSELIDLLLDQDKLIIKLRTGLKRVGYEKLSKTKLESTRKIKKSKRKSKKKSKKR